MHDLYKNAREASSPKLQCYQNCYQFSASKCPTLTRKIGNMTIPP
jgi:hypothetical protein